jgi:hypothetical protein
MLSSRKSCPPFTALPELYPARLKANKRALLKAKDGASPLLAWVDPASALPLLVNPMMRMKNDK